VCGVDTAAVVLYVALSHEEATTDRNQKMEAELTTSIFWFVSTFYN